MSDKPGAAAGGSARVASNDAPAAADGAAGASAAAPRPAKPGVISRIARDSDGSLKLWAGPVGWVVGGAAVLFLAVSSLFGGLNDAAAVPIPQADSQTVIDATYADVTVERAVLLDTSEEFLLDIAPDEDLLLLRITLTNRSDRPRPVAEALNLAYGDDPAVQRPEPGAPLLENEEQLIRVPAVAGKPTYVARLDDSGTSWIYLQPNVPTTLALGFIVKEADVPDGDLEVAVDTLVPRPYSVLSDGAEYYLERTGQAANVRVKLEKAQADG